ncbi:MAG: class I SAM-dependent methyltransferase, partial [Promethearchaeota archaeon]
WNDRFNLGGKIWGLVPSKSAFIALELFQAHSVKKILIPGAGYGRNSKLFTDNNFEVIGIEISENALEMGKIRDPKTLFISGNVLEMPFSNEKYDAIYCFNVLHLFLKEDREKFLKKCDAKLRPGALIFFVVFSDREQNYGKGKIIEPNTFESKPGRPIHYFTEQDLLNHFACYNVLETDLIEEKEVHGKLGEHVHALRYISCVKK